LCFVANKSKVKAFDNLVNVCSDFYTEDTIVAARQLLEDARHRMPKRKTVKLCTTMEGIVKVMLNPAVQLPNYYALNFLDYLL